MLESNCRVLCRGLKCRNPRNKGCCLPVKPARPVRGTDSAGCNCDPGDLHPELVRVSVLQNHLLGQAIERIHALSFQGLHLGLVSGMVAELSLGMV